MESKSNSLSCLQATWLSNFIPLPLHFHHNGFHSREGRPHRRNPACRTNSNSTAPRGMGGPRPVGRQQRDLSADPQDEETEATSQIHLNWAPWTWGTLRNSERTGEARGHRKGVGGGLQLLPAVIHSIKREVTSPLCDKHLRHSVFAPVNQIKALPCRTFQPRWRDRRINK